MATSWTSRRRRRRGFWLAALLTVVGLSFLSMGVVRSDTRTLAAYVDGARSVADTEARLASSFQDLVVRVGEVERPALIATLSELEERTAEAVTSLPPADERPESVAEAHGFLSVALTSWRDGLARFRRALLVVVDQPEDPSGSLELQGALADLGVGDRAYGRFRELAAQLRQDLDVESAELPEVRFLPSEPSPVFSSQGIVERAGGSEKLALRRDVALAMVRLEPGPIGERDGIPLVPSLAPLDVQVGVINLGNQTETGLVVSLRLERGEGTPPFEGREVVEELEPGASKTLTFESIGASPGQPSRLLVTVDPVEGEVALEDNTQELSFIRESG